MAATSAFSHIAASRSAASIAAASANAEPADDNDDDVIDNPDVVTDARLPDCWLRSETSRRVASLKAC
jgi:hypothetical protein